MNMLAKSIAIEEFLKGHTEQAKGVIKSFHRTVKLNKKSAELDFKLHHSFCPTSMAYFDGGKDGYRTVQGNKDDLFTLRSFYIGKKGDVVFIFDSPRFSKSTADRVELKLDQAFEALSSFTEFVYDLFEDLIKERFESHTRSENEKELATKAQKQLELDAIRDAKAAKYAGKLNYGAW